MALITSYVANPTQISFHHSLIPFGWIRIEHVESGSGDVVMEVRAGVSQWDTAARR